MSVFSKNIPFPSYSDEALIKEYKESRDVTIVGTLFERYTDLVFLACMKYLKNEADSEDACMQIFEKLIQDLLIYEIQAFSPWLRTVVRNHCLAQIRQHKKELQSLESMKYQGSATQRLETVYYLRETPEDKEWEIQQLEEALNSLSEAQKRCVALFYLEKKSYKEITVLTGYTLKEVKSHIQNGKRNLKNALKARTNEG